MKVVLLPCVLGWVLLTAGAAPTFEGKPISRQQLEELLRGRRSQYVPQFVSPCAAASNPSYHLDTAYPHMHPHYAYGAPHYRSVDEQVAGNELLSFSDFDHFMPEHMPMARLGGYGAPASISNQILPATSTAVYGVFPNANMGGYSVPLLFSCSPNVVPGHMMEPQSPVQSIAAPPNSYRGVDDHGHNHDLLVHHDEMTSQEHPSTIHEASKIALHTH